MEPTNTDNNPAANVTSLRARFTVEVVINGVDKPTFSPSTVERLEHLFRDRDVDEVSEEEWIDVYHQMNLETNYNWLPRIEVTEDLIEERFPPESDRDALDGSPRQFAQRRFHFFLKEFPNEIKAVAWQLLMKEHFATELSPKAPDVGSKARDRVISKAQTELKSRMRKRLPKYNGDGRPPKMLTLHGASERSEFISRCLDAFASLEKDGKDLNPTNLAGLLYAEDSTTNFTNPSSRLAGQMSTLKVSMAELKEMYSRQ